MKDYQAIAKAKADSAIQNAYAHAQFAAMFRASGMATLASKRGAMAEESRIAAGEWIQICESLAHWRG